jgi:hypothetical protein
LQKNYSKNQQNNEKNTLPFSYLTSKCAFAAAVCLAARRKRMHVVFHSTHSGVDGNDWGIVLERLGLELGSPAFIKQVSNRHFFCFTN